MSNHLHVVLKTPEPNLSRGMQSFLSGYANAWSRRHRFSGHVFQGRYRTELVEDETYLSGAKHSSNASKQWVRGEPRHERRRESRLLQSLPLSRVIVRTLKRSSVISCS